MAVGKWRRRLASYIKRKGEEEAREGRLSAG
jgi:ribosomal protein S15P/S13E